jgi:hypothetical protein
MIMFTSAPESTHGKSEGDSRRHFRASTRNTIACDRCRERKTVCRGGKPCRSCTRLKISCSYAKPPSLDRACLPCSRLHTKCDRKKPRCRNCSRLSKECRWSEKAVGKQESGYLSGFKSEGKLISPDKDFKFSKPEYYGFAFKWSRKGTSTRSKFFRIVSTHPATFWSSWILSILDQPQISTFSGKVFAP